MKAKLILLLILCLLPAALPLFHPGLLYQTDSFLYLARFSQFHLALWDGQLPPIWGADYDGGYGSPVFLFYSPLVFFFMEIPRIFGFAYINCAKITVSLSIIFSGISMFLFAREFWGKAGAFLSAVAYVYAPYHLVDVYARSAFSENMAFIWFPLILWSFYKLNKEKKITYLVPGALSYAALILTHNIMTMLFTPVIILYIGLLYLLNRNSAALRRCIAAFSLGLGLSAFFLLPAFIEKQHVILKVFLGSYFDFNKHFLSPGNFFFSDPVNALYFTPLSFQLSPVLILLSVLSLGIALKLSSAKEYIEKKYSLLFFLCLVPVYMFLMLPVSKLVWESFPLLQFVQFPWRFSALSVLSLSFASGSVALIFKQEKGFSGQVIMVAVFTVLLVLSNFGYTREEGYIAAAADELFTRDGIRKAVRVVKNYEDGIEADTPDYRPKYVQKHTKRVIEDKDKLEVLSGDIKVLNSSIRTNRHFFSLAAGQDSLVRIHTFWFPGWKAYIDNKKAVIDYNNEYGLMDIRIPSGEHKLYIALGDTPLRLGAKIISLSSLLILSGVWIKAIRL